MDTTPLGMLPHSRYTSPDNPLGIVRNWLLVEGEEWSQRLERQPPNGKQCFTCLHHATTTIVFMPYMSTVNWPFQNLPSSCIHASRDVCSSKQCWQNGWQMGDANSPNPLIQARAAALKEQAPRPGLPTVDLTDLIAPVPDSVGTHLLSIPFSAHVGGSNPDIWYYRYAISCGSYMLLGCDFIKLQIFPGMRPGQISNSQALN